MCYYEVRRGPGGDPAVGYLVYLATEPERRNRGLGTALYREAVGRMFAAGCRCVVLEVELPEAVGALAPMDGEIARRRLDWYRRNGALRLNGVVAVAGIGGPQPLPEAILIHPRPGAVSEICPCCALEYARVGLGAGAVERTVAPLALG
jgi:GNAT superfamily N-acetyltransferase